MGERTDLLQGTLDLLILKSLQLEPLHGWAISKRIRQSSRELLTINQGSLYPALYRLEEQSLVSASWGTSPEGRRTKIYKLTALGKKRLHAEREKWQLFVSAMDHVLSTE